MSEVSSGLGHSSRWTLAPLASSVTGSPTFQSVLQCSDGKPAPGSLLDARRRSRVIGNVRLLQFVENILVYYLCKKNIGDGKRILLKTFHFPFGCEDGVSWQWTCWVINGGRVEVAKMRGQVMILPASVAGSSLVTRVYSHSLPPTLGVRVEWVLLD